MLPQPFKNPSTYKDHSGVDYAQGTRELVRASGVGMIVYRGWLNGNAGYSVIVDYDEGCEVLYCHFDDMKYVPPLNTRVFESYTIGEVGTSGRSTGPHLHMEIMQGKGAHTYEGIWNYFSKTDFVGDGSGSNVIVNTDEEELMNYIRIQGKAGSHRGGTYAVFGDGKGKYSAIFVGDGGPNDLKAVTDPAAIAQLQNRIDGLR